MTWLIIIIGALLSAWLYRLGGMGDEVENKWFPKFLRHSWVRDWMIPLVLCVVLGLIGGWVWWLILVYLLTAAGLSTYWDFVPFNHGDDNFFMHGAFIGLACFPLAFCHVEWYWIAVRLCLLGIAFGQLNYWANKQHWSHSDYIEECTRGFLIVATVPLLLIIH